MTALHLRTRKFSDMDALDRHLYTSQHASTDTVARLGPDRVQLARNGWSLPSTSQLSLPRYFTYYPHPCTVLTAAHNIHTLPPDALARLAYQRPLMNPYCMFDLCRPRQSLGPRRAFPVTRRGSRVDLSGIGPAAQTCLTRKILLPLKLPVVAPVLAELTIVVTTIVDILGTGAILFRLTIPDGLDAPSRRTKIFLVTSSASFCSSAYNSGGYSSVANLAVLSSLSWSSLSMMLKNAPGWTRTERIATRLKTSSITALKYSGPLSLMPSKCSNTASQPLCAQKVWEALLTAFPLDHKSMQTALLARELVPAPRVARPSSSTRTSCPTGLATSLLSCVTSWKPTTSSLSGFSRPRTFLPTTCSTLTLFRLCSRLLYLTCLKQLSLTQTPLARILS